MKELGLAILDKIDTNTLLVIIIAMGIVFILSMIKKVAKVAISVVIVAIIAGAGIPSVEDFSKSYGFEINGKVATITVDGKETKLSADMCKNIEIIGDWFGGYTAEIENITGQIQKVSIPSYMVGDLEVYANNSGINLTN